MNELPRIVGLRPASSSTYSSTRQIKCCCTVIAQLSIPKEIQYFSGTVIKCNSNLDLFVFLTMSQIQLGLSSPGRWHLTARGTLMQEALSGRLYRLSFASVEPLLPYFLGLWWYVIKLEHMISLANRPNIT